MYNSEEFKELEKMVIDDSTYNQRRLAIGLKFLYSALDDRYKKDEDEELINKLYGKDGQVKWTSLSTDSFRIFLL
jgi:heme oxygenase